MFAVKILQVTHVPNITVSGVSGNLVVVRYTVGTDGPFTDAYPDLEGVNEKIKAGIEARVRGLRELRGGYM